MNREQRKAAIEARLKDELIAGDEYVFWMSFADPDKPKGEQFLGVIITRALGAAHAMVKTHQLGINPGGEIYCIALEDASDIRPEHFDRLLKTNELVEAGYI